MDTTSSPEIYTVSRLNLEARGLLEGRFPLLWLEGELSNVSRPASGHLYFTLKDEYAQIRAAMFKNRNALLRFTPKAGIQVLARCRVSLYEARGDFQLIIEHMEEAGEGMLRRAFEALKQKLLDEGLFDDARKRPIPSYPTAIGVITSPSGAALQDVLNVLARRYPGLPVYVYPVNVQGKEAAPSIVAALRKANLDKICDLLLLVRGGGSIEDLWAFNEESVARAIASSKPPIISGIGHETDFTIADFVADLRAPTPSAASELATPDANQLRYRLANELQALKRIIENRLATLRQKLETLQSRLDRQHPERHLEQITQRLDELETRLQHAGIRLIEKKSTRLQTLRARIWAQAPSHRLSVQHARLEHLRSALIRHAEGAIQQKHQQLVTLARTLEAVSPLATLQRGYALALKPNSLTPISNAADLQAGELIEVRLARGRVLCQVNKVET